MFIRVIQRMCKCCVSARAAPHSYLARCAMSREERANAPGHTAKLKSTTQQQAWNEESRHCCAVVEANNRATPWDCSIQDEQHNEEQLEDGEKKRGRRDCSHREGTPWYHASRFTTNREWQAHQVEGKRKQRKVMDPATTRLSNEADRRIKMATTRRVIKDVDWRVNLLNFNTLNAVLLPPGVLEPTEDNPREESSSSPNNTVLSTTTTTRKRPHTKKTTSNCSRRKSSAKRTKTPSANNETFTFVEYRCSDCATARRQHRQKLLTRGLEPLQRISWMWRCRSNMQVCNQAY